MEQICIVVEEDYSGEKWGKLRIGGLSRQTTDYGLEKYFSTFGQVADAFVETYGKRSRGFGFVTFVDSSSIATVLSNGPHQLDGRMIDPEPDIPNLRRKKFYWANRLYLHGLKGGVREVNLRYVFEPYGKILGIDVIYHRHLKRNRGFGFVSFDSAEPVHRLLVEGAVNVDGKRVQIDRALPKNTGRRNCRNYCSDRRMKSGKGPSDKNREGKDNNNLAWELVPKPLLSGFEYSNEPLQGKSDFGCALHMVYLLIIFFILSSYFVNFYDQFFTPMWKKSESENL